LKEDKKVITLTMVEHQIFLIYDVSQWTDFQVLLLLRSHQALQQTNFG